MTVPTEIKFGMHMRFVVHMKPFLIHANSWSCLTSTKDFITESITEFAAIETTTHLLTETVNDMAISTESDPETTIAITEGITQFTAETSV